jgi:hypothetical protein
MEHAEGNIMRRGTTFVTLLGICLLSGTTNAGKVQLSLEVNPAAMTWSVFAAITDTTIEFETGEAGPNDEILGIAYFNVDVTGLNGISVTSSQMAAPVGTSGPLDVTGFRLFQFDGEQGLHIAAAQDTFTDPASNPDVVLEGVGLTPGSDAYGATWSFPALLGTGSYTGTSGQLMAVPRDTGLGPGMTLLYGDPAEGFTDTAHVEFASVVTNAMIEVSECIAGDVNCDGEVGLADFTILKENFGNAGGRGDGDLNGNGEVDLVDFTVLKESFGDSAAPVPEPASLVLWAVGTLAILRRTQRFQRFRPSRA